MSYGFGVLGQPCCSRGRPEVFGSGYMRYPAIPRSAHAVPEDLDELCRHSYCA